MSDCSKVEVCPSLLSVPAESARKLFAVDAMLTVNVNGAVVGPYNVNMVLGMGTHTAPGVRRTSPG